MDLEKLFLLLVILFCVVLLVTGMDLPMSSSYTIGPGFLPRIFSIASIIICVILLVQSRNKGNKSTIDKDGLKRLVIYFISLIALTYCMEKIGILVSLAVFLFFVIFTVEKYSLKTSISVAVFTPVIIYLVFDVWLGVPITILNFL